MRLFGWELRKLAGDATARAGLAVVAAVMLLALVVFAAGSRGRGGGTVIEKLAAGELPLPGKCLKGMGFARIALPYAAGLLVPAVVCVVLSGALAGELERGTLDEALTRPVARWKLLAAKLGAGLVYVAVLMGAAALVALAAGSLVLGPGELYTAFPKVTMAPAGGAADAPRIACESLAGGAAAVRLVAAHAVAAAALAPVAALALFVSAAAGRARSAAVVALGAYFGLYSIAKLDGLGPVRRYLVVRHMAAWQAFLKPEVAWDEAVAAAVVLAVVFAFLTGGAILVLGGRELPPRA